MHCAFDDAPTLLVSELAGQAMQRCWPVPGWYRLRSHGWQTDWPVIGLLVPGPHGRHWLSPVTLPNVPVGQSSHAVAPVLLAYWPVRQGWHGVEKDGANEPGPQAAKHPVSAAQHTHTQHRMSTAHL